MKRRLEVHLGGRRLRLDPSSSLGRGGEAEVFALGDGRALKLFKAPDHPDYDGLPDEQEGARRRLATIGAKLAEFPALLPPRVVVPEELATSQGGEVVGYAMRRIDGAEHLLRYGDPTFRRQVGATLVTEVFRDLRASLAGLHEAQVVIGDCNDLNVLVDGPRAHLIDADSYQFGRWPSLVFSERFVDPLDCAPGPGGLLRRRPPSVDSDWFAFTVMLMQSLLFVGPWGGIYRPTDPAKSVPPWARPLQRISVFHPEVRYPKPAADPRLLPDELLHHLEAVVVRDRRGPFPAALLDNLAWQRCPSCGREHGRLSCPLCAPLAGAKALPVLTVRGQLQARRQFTTPGVIVAATVEEGALAWLVHEAGELRREDGRVVLRGALPPGVVAAPHGPSTLVGRGGQLVLLAPNRPPERRTVDFVAGRPAFAANRRHLFRAAGGRIWRDDPLGPEPWGEILAGQTRLFLGEELGLGLYRAGELSVLFLFHPERRGLLEVPGLPRLAGQLIDVAAVLGEGRAWVRFTLERGGRPRELLVVVDAGGGIVATAEEEVGGWTQGLPGACPSGGFLLVPTDGGIARYEVQGGAIVRGREFPDSEPFVDAASRLLLTRDGLCVVAERSITQLTLNE